MSEAKLLDFKTSFITWLKDNSEIGREIQSEILEAAGIEEDEMIEPMLGFDFAFMKIPVQELGIFGTDCGGKGNKPFTKEVISFLQSRKIEFIIVLSENKRPIISAVAIHLNEKDGEVLSDQVKINEGSLRCEPSKIQGWSIFESE
jgi:hypothetical protein